MHGTLRVNWTSLLINQKVACFCQTKDKSSCSGFLTNAFRYHCTSFPWKNFSVNVTKSAVPNPQENADLVTFTEEIFNGKLHFLCNGIFSYDLPLTILMSFLQVFFKTVLRPSFIQSWLWLIKLEKCLLYLSIFLLLLFDISILSLLAELFPQCYSQYTTQPLVKQSTKWKQKQKNTDLNLIINFS